MPELTQLAEEIRERLIVGVAKTGGHIGPNLGVVELTLGDALCVRYADRTALCSM